MYHQPFKCQVLNSTSTTPVAPAKPAVWCEGAPSNCTVGAKQMIYWNQASGNNIEVDGYDLEGDHKSPAYNSKCGFKDGMCFVFEKNLFVFFSNGYYLWNRCPKWYFWIYFWLGQEKHRSRIKFDRHRDIRYCSRRGHILSQTYYTSIRTCGDRLLVGRRREPIGSPLRTMDWSYLPGRPDLINRPSSHISCYRRLYTQELTSHFPNLRLYLGLKSSFWSLVSFFVVQRWDCWTLLYNIYLILPSIVILFLLHAPFIETCPISGSFVFIFLLQVTLPVDRVM